MATVLIECGKCHRKSSRKHEMCPQCGEQWPVTPHFYKVYRENGKQKWERVFVSEGDVWLNEAWEVLEKIYETMREWKKAEYIKDYRNLSREKVNQKQREKAKELVNGYVSRLLTKDSFLSSGDIPNELIELKKLHILALRELRKRRTA